jgi:hypothetical protein
MLTEVDYAVYTMDRRPLKLDLSKLEEPYSPRWFEYTRRAARQRGGDVDASKHIHSMVYAQNAFENIVSREFWIPISPWSQGTDPESKWWNSVGETAQQGLLVRKIFSFFFLVLSIA